MPLVLDADALNAFAAEPARLEGRDGTAIVITPHPGEMARLTGLSTDDVQAHRLEVAREFAATHRVHVVLKGHRTVIASPDGQDDHQSHRQPRHGDRRYVATCWRA